MPEVVESTPPPPPAVHDAEDQQPSPIKPEPEAAEPKTNGEAAAEAQNGDAAAEEHKEEEEAAVAREEEEREEPPEEENGRASPVEAKQEEEKPAEGVPVSSEVVPVSSEVVPFSSEVVPVSSEVDGETCVRRMRQDWNKKAPAPAQPADKQNGGPRKVAMSTSLDTENVRAAYDDVRSDGSETQWAVFKFEGAKIRCAAKGSDFAEFKAEFSENERCFGYIRIQTGDEMSKRQKFLFVTWVGQSVSVLQRAKMSTDKSVIKNVISNFAVELQLENLNEIDLNKFIEELNKAGGANYGTGVRDI